MCFRCKKIFNNNSAYLQCYFCKYYICCNECGFYNPKLKWLTNFGYESSKTWRKILIVFSCLHDNNRNFEYSLYCCSHCYLQSDEIIVSKDIV